MRVALNFLLGLLLLGLLHAGLRPYWRAVARNGATVPGYEPLRRSWLWEPEFRPEREKSAEEIEEEWKAIEDVELNERATASLEAANGWDAIAAAANAKERADRKLLREELRARGLTVDPTELSWVVGELDWLRTVFEAGSLLACAIVLAVARRAR